MLNMGDESNSLRRGRWRDDKDVVVRLGYTRGDIGRERDREIVEARRRENE